MSPAEVFIRRPVATFLLSLGLFLVGMAAFSRLPVAPLPRVDLPMIMVQARLPGADPETMAATVAAPLERRLGTIAGVNEMTSSSGQGSTSIAIQFDLDRNIEGAARDVQAALSAAGGDMPADMPNPPTYRKANPADMPILILGITAANMTAGKLYDASDTILASRISQIEGVAQVTVSGAEKPAVRIRVNPARAAAMGLSMEEIRTQVAAANASVPKGQLDGADQALSLAANDQLSTAAGYAPLVMKAKDGSVVRLSAIASVVDGVENTRQAGWFNRDRAVLVIVQKQADANIIDTIDRIRAELPRLESWMPAGAKVSVINDRGTTIRASVHDVERTLLITIVLVILVVMVSLGRKTPTVAASVTVPLSLAGTFAVMWALGYTLDNISLMALTISVGFVVDDAIVMIENIARHIEAGETDMLTAAIKGANEITFTVISISLSLVAVFIPLLFMGGVVGRMFGEFAVTLTAAIAISALVSIVVTPTVYAHLSRVAPSGPRAAWLGFGEKAMARLEERYVAGLSWVMRHQGFMLLVMLATVLATIGLYIVVPKGFVPQQDTGLIMAMTDARPDISFKAMAERQQRAADIILKDPAISGLGSFVGGGGFNSAANQGRMFIALKPLSERDASADQVINRLRPKLAGIEGLTVFLQAVQDLRMGGRDSRGQYQFVLWGDSLAELRDWSARLVDALKTAEGFADVTSDQDKATPQLDVVVDRDKAARLGLDITDVDNLLQNAFAQRQISTIYTQRNQYHVVLEVDPAFQQDRTALDHFHLVTAAGQTVPLSAVAKLQDTTAPLSVSHQGQFPAITITYNLTPGTSLGDASTRIEAVSERIGLPASIRAEAAGNARAFQQNASSQPLLILAALVAIYVVLGMLYESYLHPLTIISTLPSAGLGALLALLATGQELSLISVIGVILLMGIVKKNGIMMVDFAVAAERRRSISPERSIMEAARKRFRPITMTTLAAVLGAVPLAFSGGVGSELRRPLGIAIVGGLIVSQMLTLYTTPVVYVTLAKLARRRAARTKPNR